MADLYFAWWNVENLFDEENSPTRIDWLKRKLAGELAGWTPAVLDTKLGQLSQVIRAMNSGQGPDLLGLCEVENEAVLAKLAARIAADGGRGYAMAHRDSPDQRGIDIAFLYDPQLFDHAEIFTHFVVRRTGTRDLLQVNFTHRPSSTPFAVIGNHWPSRSGGQYESEPYRMTAGETLGYWHGRIREERGEDFPVLAMGDFNDEPIDRSLREYALAINARLRVENAERPTFWNLAAALEAAGLGTYYFNNDPNLLDQMLVNRSIIKGAAGVTLAFDAAGQPRFAIERFPAMVKTGIYGVPRPFGRPSEKGFDPTGFSDHYPVSVVLTL